ncbi:MULTISPECIES: hypothetical protein [unclassified Streptococcus]|uniref:hypothetical protein n=1 Tax=unclassified Streptococcus TaxID=2608887 RepID=UPI000AEF2047|nr:MULTISPECIES: hypothetical protein [unclassified Streptococcus]
MAKAQAATKAAKAQAKGQVVDAVVSEEISTDSVKQIIFACDAGMGSSAMGASLLRDKVKKAGLSLPVTNKAISNLEDTDHTLIVMQEELTPRAKQRTPRAIHVSVENFLTSTKYDEIVAQLLHEAPKSVAAVPSVSSEKPISLNGVTQVVFPFDKTEGSATMGKETFKAILKNKGINLSVSTLVYVSLSQANTIHQIACLL